MSLLTIHCHHIGGYDFHMNLEGRGDKHWVHNSYNVPSTWLHTPPKTSKNNNCLHLPDDNIEGCISVTSGDDFIVWANFKLLWVTVWPRCWLFLPAHSGHSSLTKLSCSLCQPGHSMQPIFEFTREKKKSSCRKASRSNGDSAEVCIQRKVFTSSHLAQTTAETRPHRTAVFCSQASSPNLPPVVQCLPSRPGSGSLLIPLPLLYGAFPLPCAYSLLCLQDQ